jgi:hypothetical protein
VDWPEGVLENIVAHVIAFYDALIGVELPMYAYVNPALRVVVFRVAKRIVRGWLEGHEFAVNIPILAVEFIRDKSKFCCVRPKVAQDLEQGTADCCVA